MVSMTTRLGTSQMFADIDRGISPDRPEVIVLVEQTGEHYPCATSESLLRGMLKRGRKGIPAGCVNGGCGVCKVRIVEGEVTVLGPVSRAHVSAEEEACGFTLACRVAPVTTVRLRIAGKFEKAVFEWVRRLGEPNLKTPET